MGILLISQIGLAFIFAIFIQSKRIYGRELHRRIIFLPAVLAPIVVGMIWQIVYNADYGLIAGVMRSIGFENFRVPWLDSPKLVILSIAIALTWQYVGQFTIILMAGMQNISVSILESATIREHILRIVLNLIAVAISITCVFPLVWLFYSSLKTKGEFISNTLSLPTSFQFSNYVKAFELGNLVTSSLNSTFYVVINVVLVTVAATISAYFFARYEFPGKKLIYFIYLLGFLVPIYGMLVPVFLQFRLLGLINKRLVLIFPYYAMQVSLAIFLIESFIKGIPREIDEAASIDGCGVGRLIMNFIFPLSGPAIATVIILTSLATWNEFGFSAVLIRDIDLRTVSVAVRAFRAGLELEYTFMMAALVSVSIPIVLLYFVFSKYIISGITTSGVKG